MELIEKFGLDQQEQAQRIRFVQLDKRDFRLLRELQPLMSRHAQGIVDKFYEHLLEFDDARAFFDDEKSLSRVKSMQCDYLIDLCSGEVTDSYIERRLQIGVVHERIGLVPKWYIGSYASFMRLIFPLIAKKYWYRPAKLINTILALSKIMNFDQQLVIDTYIGSIVGKLEEGVSVLTTSSNEIQTLTTQVASGSAQTGSSISEVTATIEEVSQTTRTSVERARQVSESAEKASESAQTGSRAVQESIERLQQIQLQMGSIAESVVRLSEQGQAIGEIITTVNELAEQSNLLAVNAAIEAARAGEQGKGFTVVAQEVKNLAEQSKQATTQVRAILSDIQKATTEAVLVTEQGSKSVEAGVKQSQETGELIRTLTDSISQAAQATLQIAASSQQQLAGVNQVATAMQNIKQATEQNIAGTRQAETTANSLKDLGTRLRQLGARYQV